MVIATFVGGNKPFQKIKRTREEERQEPLMTEKGEKKKPKKKGKLQLKDEKAIYPGFLEEVKNPLLTNYNKPIIPSDCISWKWKRIVI